MQNLLNSLLELSFAIMDLVVVLGAILLPWLPLIVWLCFWLFAVNWTKLRIQLTQGGGWVGLLLIAVVWIIVWGVVAPPASGSYDLFGLHIGNFVGKTVYVTSLYCLMLLAGAAQLSGAFAGCCQFAEPVIEEHGHGNHGHGGHAESGHGNDHDSHGHAAVAHVEHH
ncbi:MAG: hypothetical protein JWM11_1844 [Planctomycetaceae bacterium]|nr:hypothetical protein [Planctomycetaceae bacterium]